MEICESFAQPLNIAGKQTYVLNILIVFMNYYFNPISMSVKPFKTIFSTTPIIIIHNTGYIFETIVIKYKIRYVKSRDFFYIIRCMDSTK